MNLYIQDPTFSGSYSLHEALIEACSNANHGAGAYAFVKKEGINLFMDDPMFEGMINRGEYYLIAGMDAITDEKALDTLKELERQYENLTCSAYLHGNSGTIFHPKFSWFKNTDGGGQVVLGSGNLTASGLRRNREAFSVINVSQSEIEHIETYWNSWLQESTHYLKPLNDQDVINKARSNKFRRRVPVLPALPDDEGEREEEGAEELEEWGYDEESRVLIAEIPRSKDRWNQANFNKETFIEFFGATPGNNSQRILLRNVQDDAMLAEIEVRPSVSVKSQNYRFELGAAAGIGYPLTGRPIAVFVRLSKRVFLYSLFMPSHSLHQDFATWLDDNWVGRTDRMKRITVDYVSVQEKLELTVLNAYKL